MAIIDFSPGRPLRRKVRRPGFTLVETLVTVILMVIVFAFLATIFSRASVIHQLVRRGGDAENFGALAINTFLYGPGIDRHEGLVGSPYVFLPAAGDLQPVEDDFPEEHRSRYLAFRSGDWDDVVVYRLGAGARPSVLRSRQSGLEHDFTDPAWFVDLRPAWAREQEVVLREDESWFEFYNIDLEPVTVAGLADDSIAWVFIRLALGSTLQPEEETVFIERLVRVRNTPPRF